MEKINLQLNSGGDIAFLTNYATRNGICGYVEGNHSKVAINSILGWFSLDLSQPQTIISTSPTKDIDLFSQALTEKGIMHEVVTA